MTGKQVNTELYAGAWLVAEIVSAVLFGILTVQCMVYLTQFKRDKWGIRGLVLTIWILDLSMVTFASVWTYLAILRNFGNGLGMLSSAKWSISPGCVDISINGFMVQLFYARRGYLLNKSLWPISLSAIVLATISFISGIVFAIRVRILLQKDSLTNDLWINYLWFTSAAATDLLVAFIVVLSLGATRYSYSPDAQRGLRKLIIYTISNGILTSIVAVAGVVLTFVGPPSWIQPGLTVVLARLYSNSLLASLNLRGKWIPRQQPLHPSSGTAAMRLSHTNKSPTDVQSNRPTSPKALFSAITLADPDGFQPVVSVEE